MTKIHDVSKVRSCIADDALRYACKVLPRVCRSLSIEIESGTGNTTGIRKITFKGAKGALYGCMYFNVSGVNASLCCQNRGMGLCVVDYRGADNAITLAHFEKYIPVQSTVRRDFADAIKRCHEFIDLLADLSPWSGWVVPESNWDRDDVKSQSEVQAMAKMFASTWPSYGVHTKREFKEQYGE